MRRRTQEACWWEVFEHAEINNELDCGLVVPDVRPAETRLEMILRSGCGVGATLSVTKSPHGSACCDLATPQRG
jgi:hypothetical protein